MIERGVCNMKKSLIISLIALSLSYGVESNATNATVEANKSISDKATDLLGDLTNSTKEIANDAQKSATSLIDKTKEEASSLVDTIKTKTNQLLDNNSTINIDVEKLYKKCAGCHGSDGKTPALNKSPIIAGSDYNTTLTKLQGYQAGELDTAGMGRLMTTQVDGMEPEELEALAEYIAKMGK